MSISKSLQTRIISGLTMAALLIAALFASLYSFMAIMLLLTFLGAWEYQTLIQKYAFHEKRKDTEDKWFFTIVSGLLFLLITGTATDMLPLKYLAYLLPLFFCFFLKELFEGAKNPFVRLGFNYIGLIYIAIPFALLVVVANYGGSYYPSRVLGIFVLLWANDVMAYFTGKAFGKTKLFKRVSPNKTWEGSAGGAVSTLVMALVLGGLFPEAFSPTIWLGLGVIVAIMGSLGDLVESLLKRSIGVKDSGTIMPGHGGILDRFDALLFALPFIYAFLLLA